MLCCIFLLLAAVVAAVLLLGPNEKRQDISQSRSECLKLLLKIKDANTANLYSAALKEKLEDGRQKMSNNDYVESFRSESLSNILYDYCHNHWSVLFGSEDLRRAILLSDQCMEIMHQGFWGHQELEETMKSYYMEWVVFEGRTTGVVLDRMLWKPTPEEIDRMSK